MYFFLFHITQEKKSKVSVGLLMRAFGLMQIIKCNMICNLDQCFSLASPQKL